MTAPLLYVCVRPQQGAAAAEYESFRTAMRLDEAELAQHDLVRDPLPDDVFERYSGFLVGGSPFNVDRSGVDQDRRAAPARGRPRAHRGSRRRRRRRPPRCSPATASASSPACSAARSAAPIPENTGPVTIELTARWPLGPRCSAGSRRGSPPSPPTRRARARCRPVPRCWRGTTPARCRRTASATACTRRSSTPSPPPSAFTERMAVYRDDGYFAANDYDAHRGTRARGIRHRAGATAARLRPRFGPAPA